VSVLRGLVMKTLAQKRQVSQWLYQCLKYGRSSFFLSFSFDLYVEVLVVAGDCHRQNEYA
jgi:hypothetical protein